MIKAIVVDDEPLARGIIEAYVRKTPFFELVGSFPSATDALQAITSGSVDVAFLDIQMPDMTGLELSRLTQSSNTKVIFTTAFDKYAIEGFKVDAVDYLLKPISYADFMKAAQRVRERIETELAAKDGSAEKAKEDAPRSMFIKCEYKMIQVGFSSVLYIEGAKDYVIIHLEDGTRLMPQMTMKSMESQLPQNMFIRVHRSFIVNLDKVKVIEQGCIVFPKVAIPISDSAKDRFYSLLSKRSVL